MNHTFDRRQFLGGLTAAAALTTSPLWAQGNRFLVGNWGGNYSERFARIVEEPLAARNGLTVVHELGDGPSRKSKLLLERDLSRPSIDIAHLTDYDAYEMTEQEILEKLDTSKLPNLPNLIPGLATDYYIPWAVAVIAIAYNPNKVPKVTSYADLWDPQWKGRVGLNDLTANETCEIAALLNGGSMSNYAPAEEKLRELKSTVEPRVYPTHEHLAAAFANEEVWIMPQYTARILQLKRTGAPIEFVFPTEGSVALSFGAGIPKRAASKDAAYDYLNSLMDPAVAGALASDSLYPAAITNPEMSDEDRALVLIPEADRAKLNVSNPAYKAEQMASLQQWWSRIVKG